jgi:hypothetical protein
MFNQRNGVHVEEAMEIVPRTTAVPYSCSSSSSSTPPQHLVAKKSKDERDVGCAFNGIEP